MAKENSNIIKTLYLSEGFELYSTQIMKGQQRIEKFTKTTTDAEGKLIKETRTLNTSVKDNTKYTASNSQVKETNAQMTKRVAAEQAKSNQLAKQGSAGMKDLTNAMRRAILVAPIWLALRTIMMKTIELFKSSIKFLIDWEAQMAKLKIVGGGTAEEFDRLSSSLLVLAKNYGISLDQLGQGSALWSQQGRAISEIAPLMETTIKMSMLTGRSMSDTVEDLTSVMKNFGISAQNSGIILDSVTSVMLKSAISSDVLVAALKNSASIASQVGISFDKLNGLITSMHVASRAAGGAIGKAWVTIFSRMGTVAVGAIQKIAQVPVYLDSTGKAVTQNTGVLRPMGQVLDEIAAKWSGLSNELQTQLGVQIAGIRRANLFTSAMQQYDEGLKATLNSLDSYGKGQEAANIILETTDSKIKQLINSWKKFIDTIANTQGLKNTIDGLKGVIEHLERLSQWSAAPASLFIYLTPEAGKAYDLALESKKLREESLALTEKEAGNAKIASKLTEELIQKIKAKNDLLARGGDLNKLGVDEFDRWIKSITTKLSEQKGFGDIVKLPIDEMLKQLEKMSPALAEKVISNEALVNVEKRKSALLEQMADMRTKYNSIVEKALPVSPFKLIAKVITSPAEITPMKNLKKEAEEIAKTIEKIKEKEEGWGAVGERIASSQIVAGEASKKLLEDMIKSKEEYNKLDKDGVQQEIDSIKNQQTAHAETQKNKDLEFDFTNKLFELKKQIIEQDLSEADAIKLKIALYQEYDTVVGDSATTIQNLQLDELENIKKIGKERIKQAEKLAETQEKAFEKQTKLQEKLSDLVIASEIDLFKMKGASESEAIKLKMALESQLGINQSIEDRLKNQLDLEKAITKEKNEQINLSSESLTLYEIGRKYGAETAKEVAKAVQSKEGEVRLRKRAIKGDKEAKAAYRVFKKYFPEKFKESQAIRYFNAEGVSVPIKERKKETEPDRSQALTNYLKTLTQTPATQEKPDEQLGIDPGQELVKRTVEKSVIDGVMKRTEHLLTRPIQQTKLPEPHPIKVQAIAKIDVSMPPISITLSNVTEISDKIIANITEQIKNTKSRISQGITELVLKI